MSDLDFLDDNDIDLNDDPFAPLKEGWYELTVKKASVEQNSSQTGHYVNVGAQTPEGRWVWTKYNVKHKSADAQRIGRQEFARLCVACGFRGSVKDSQALIDRRFRGYVVIDEWQGRRDNKVKQTEAIPGAAPATVPMPKKPAANPWAS